MGEIADMMLDGTLCASCGDYLGDDTGFASYCIGCEPKSRRPLFSAKGGDGRNPNKTNCKTCGKRVKKAGLADHMRDAHKGK